MPDVRSEDGGTTTSAFHPVLTFSWSVAGAALSTAAQGGGRQREQLHAESLGLIRSVFRIAKGVRLAGVTLSNFAGDASAAPGELRLDA